MKTNRKLHSDEISFYFSTTTILVQYFLTAFIFGDSLKFFFLKI